MVTVTELGQANRTNTVTASSAGLTGFDPILDDPGSRRTMVVRAGTSVTTANLRKGSVFTASRRKAVRNEGEAGVALPRRDYRPIPVYTQSAE